MVEKTYTKEEVKNLIDPLIKQIEFLDSSRIRCLYRLSNSPFAWINGNLKFCANEYNLLKESDTLIGNTIKNTIKAFR